MADFFAYIHARPDTADASGIFYVGKGQGKRHTDFYHRTQFHKNIVAKHGAASILVGKYDCSDEATAVELERGLIKCLRRSGVKLANLTDGGDGLSGHRHTEETKAKMRAARLGWSPSAETREKIRQSSLGKPSVWVGRRHSEETKAKIAAARRGKPNPHAKAMRTPEAIAKMSATKLAHPFVDCPHCGFHGRFGSAMKRYHFDNCKYKGAS